MRLATYVTVYGPFSYRRKVAARRTGYRVEDHEPTMSYGMIAGFHEDYAPITFRTKDYDEQVWPRKHWS